MNDDVVARFLAFDGRVYWIGQGWSVRIRAWRTRPAAARPHGLRYALTLHDETGARVLGFDNAHGVARRRTYDHQHRFGRLADPVPYPFVDADTLLVDFFKAVEQACREAGVDMTVEREETMPRTDGAEGEE